MTKQALLAAREALLKAGAAKLIDGTYLDSDCSITQALALIESALAQTEQEPVATDHELMECLGGQIGASEPHPIYRAPQPVNQMLVEALKAMVENFEFGDMNDGEYAAIQKARAALAAVGEK